MGINPFDLWACQKSFNSHEARKKRDNGPNTVKYKIKNIYSLCDISLETYEEAAQGDECLYCLNANSSPGWLQLDSFGTPNISLTSLGAETIQHYA